MLSSRSRIIFETLLLIILFGSIIFGFLQEGNIWLVINKIILFIFLFICGIAGINVIWNMFDIIFRERRSRKTEIRTENVEDAIRDALNSYSKAAKGARDIHLTIMTSEDDPEFLSVKYYSENLKESPTIDVRLRKHEGCPGKSWAEDRTFFFDRKCNLMDNDGRPIGYPSWNMPKEQAKKTKDMQVVLSVPVLNPQPETDSSGRGVVILNIASHQDMSALFSSHEWQLNAEAFSTLLAKMFLLGDQIN